MKQKILYFLILINFYSFGQNECRCGNSMFIPSTKKLPDTVFTFSNGRKIMLCGFREKIKRKVFFSEFIVQMCDKENEISFRSAMETCSIYFKNDSLTIAEIRSLPTGKNRTYETTEWKTEKIYFTKEVVGITYNNYNFRKYSEEEIQATIKEFKEARGTINDPKMQLLNRLFISAMSGSEKAKDYFIRFKTKFGILDGAFAEEYHELEEMLNPSVVE